MVGGMEQQVALQAKYLSEIPNIKVMLISPRCFQGLFSEKIEFIPMRNES